ASGNLFVSDLGNHRVRKISTGGVITTVAGNGAPGFSGDGGPATAAQLRNPAGIAIDPAGNLIIADYGNHRVRKVTPGGTITTIAGTGTDGYSGDGGPATLAKLGLPAGAPTDPWGTVYIADSGKDVVPKATPGR